MNICCDKGLNISQKKNHQSKTLFFKSNIETIQKIGYSTTWDKQKQLSDNYSPMHEALSCLKSDRDVKIATIKDEIYFIPKHENKKTGIVLYPGANVDNRSYAPLAKRLAKRGISVIIAKNSLSNVFKNKTRKLIEKNQNIDNWYVAGHSLGGVMASESAFFNADKIDGVIMFASFPMKRFANKNTRFLDIRATNDDVLQKKAADISYKMTVPNKQYTQVNIVGGNHANFGYYGIQKGDGNATISREQQQKQILNSILDFVINK